MHGWPYGIWGKAHRKGLGEQQLLSQHYYLPVSSISASPPWMEQDHIVIYVTQNTEQNDTTFPIKVEHCPHL